MWAQEFILIICFEEQFIIAFLAVSLLAFQVWNIWIGYHIQNFVIVCQING